MRIGRSCSRHETKTQKRKAHPARFNRSDQSLLAPIKYSLFPPLGLATLAAYFDDSVAVTLVDEHVEKLTLDDSPDLVVIQVYITNAYRAYALADRYRSRGSYVVLGGLHVTALPEEAERHADSIFLGPGEFIFPAFLDDLANGAAKKIYSSSLRTLDRLPPIRRIGHPNRRR